MFPGQIVEACRKRYHPALSPGSFDLVVFVDGHKQNTKTKAHGSHMGPWAVDECGQLLERDPGTQLNGSGDERLGRSSERRVGHVAVDAGQIDLVEHVFEIEAQLQAALLGGPFETNVLQPCGIPLNHPRIAATVAPQVSLRPRRGGREDTGRKQAGEVVLFAIDRKSTRLNSS